MAFRAIRSRSPISAISMAGIKLALALSFVILLLLSPSPEISASSRGSAEPADKTISREAREINVHVKKGRGGGRGGGGGGGGGRGGGYAGGGMIYPVHVGGHKTSNGTRRSSAVGPRPSLLATAAACSSLCLGLLSASTLV